MTRGQLEPLTPDALGDRWLEAWATGRFASVCAVDVHYEDPATREPLTGLGPLEAHARMLHDAFVATANLTAITMLILAVAFYLNFALGSLNITQTLGLPEAEFKKMGLGTRDVPDCRK